jgi:glutaredoxin 3
MYTIYGRPQCTFCEAAKKLLKEKGLAFEYIDIVMKPEERAIMFSRVENASGGPPRMVPQIFIGDAYVGGYDQLVNKVVKGLG